MAEVTCKNEKELYCRNEINLYRYDDDKTTTGIFSKVNESKE